jgi:uncharacterized membrane protein
VGKDGSVVMTVHDRLAELHGPDIEATAESLRACLADASYRSADAVGVDIPPCRGSRPGVPPNTAAMLCYLPIHGIFLLASIYYAITAHDRPFVRFAALQSLIQTAASTLALIVVAAFAGTPVVLLDDGPARLAATVILVGLLVALALANAGVHIYAAVQANKGRAWVMPDLPDRCAGRLRSVTPWRSGSPSYGAIVRRTAEERIDERQGNTENNRYPRDMRGYGKGPPEPQWPGEARGRQLRVELRGRRRDERVARRSCLRDLPAGDRGGHGAKGRPRPQCRVDVRVWQPRGLLARPASVRGARRPAHRLRRRYGPGAQPGGGSRHGRGRLGGGVARLPVVRLPEHPQRVERSDTPERSR